MAQKHRHALDGTICFKGIPVSQGILSKLEQLTGVGHEVIFASASISSDEESIIRHIDYIVDHMK